MSGDNVWGDNIMLIAISYHLGLNIHVIHKDGNVIFIKPNRNGKRDVWIYFTGSHYSSLVAPKQEIIEID